MTKETAVVILNWNGLKFLKEFLPGVVTHSPEADVIVADNGSQDDSISWIRQNQPSVQIIEIGSNKGFCGGYNHAFKLIDHQFAVLLNSDVEVTPGWLPPVITTLKASEKVAACQPKIKQWHNKQYFEYAGAAGGFIDYLGYPFCRGRLFDTTEPDTGQYDEDTDIFWAGGACIAVRLPLYKQVGGLDEDFFAHMEEIDLCWRLKNRGYHIRYCHSSTVYHVGGGTLSRSNPRKTYLNFYNSLVMLAKNDRSQWTYLKLVIRLVMDVAAALKFMEAGLPADARMVAKAQRKFWHDRSYWLSKRKKMQQKAIVVSHPEQYKKSIAWQYFVGKKKAFRELPDVRRAYLKPSYLKD